LPAYPARAGRRRGQIHPLFAGWSRPGIYGNPGKSAGAGRYGTNGGPRRPGAAHGRPGRGPDGAAVPAPTGHGTGSLAGHDLFAGRSLALAGPGPASPRRARRGLGGGRRGTPGEA